MTAVYCKTILATFTRYAATFIWPNQNAKSITTSKTKFKILNPFTILSFEPTIPYRGFKPSPVFVLTYAKTSKKKSRITIEAFVIVIKANDAQTLSSKPSIGGSTCIPQVYAVSSKKERDRKT